MKAGIVFQAFAGGADRVLVPVDAVQRGRTAGQAQNALAVAAAAQRAVGIHAVGTGLHPFHHFVKQDGNMVKFHGYSLFAPGLKPQRFFQKRQKAFPFPIVLGAG